MKILHAISRRVSFHLLAALSLSPLLLSSLSFQSSYNVLAQNQVEPHKLQQQLQPQQPNINAAYVYHTANMILGNNIKNLLILLPNEDHEPLNYQQYQMRKDLRVINQTYVPDNVVVNRGTTIVWFNSDVGHRHEITLVNNNSKNAAAVYQSGLFNNFTASKPVKLNDTGTFTYSGPSFNKDAPDYKMNGTITVVNQPLATVLSTNATMPSTGGKSVTANNIDTIIPFIVPLNQQGKMISDFKGKGFGIDSTYVFNSVRGDGKEGCGDTQESLLQP
jgi:plastocyanin